MSALHGVRDLLGGVDIFSELLGARNFGNKNWLGKKDEEAQRQGLFAAKARRLAPGMSLEEVQMAGSSGVTTAAQGGAVGSGSTDSKTDMMVEQWLDREYAQYLRMLDNYRSYREQQQQKQPELPRFEEFVSGFSNVFAHYRQRSWMPQAKIP